MDRSHKKRPSSRRRSAIRAGLPDSNRCPLITRYHKIISTVDQYLMANNHFVFDTRREVMLNCHTASEFLMKTSILLLIYKIPFVRLYTGHRVQQDNQIDIATKEKPISNPTRRRTTPWYPISSLVRHSSAKTASARAPLNFITDLDNAPRSGMSNTLSRLKYSVCLTAKQYSRAAQLSAHTPKTCLAKRDYRPFALDRELPPDLIQLNLNLRRHIAGHTLHFSVEQHRAIFNAQKQY